MSICRPHLKLAETSAKYIITQKDTIANSEFRGIYSKDGQCDFVRPEVYYICKAIVIINKVRYLNTPNIDIIYYIPYSVKNNITTLTTL